MSALSDSQKTLAEFRDGQRNQHLSPDAHVIVRALAEGFDVESNPGQTSPVASVITQLLPASPIDGRSRNTIGKVAVSAMIDGEASLDLADLTFAPLYANPKSLILTAPTTNTATVWFSQSNAVRAATHTTAFEVERLFMPPAASLAYGATLTATPGCTAEVVGSDIHLVAISGGGGAAKWDFPLGGLPPGNYTLTLDIGDVDDGSGSGLNLYLLVDNIVDTSLPTAGNETLTFSFTLAAASNITVRAIATTSEPDTLEEMTITGNLNLTETSYPAAAAVGTPLAPGQSVSLTLADGNLAAGGYAVAPAGAGSQSIIANYLY